jgi:hypothetical protein
MKSLNEEIMEIKEQMRKKTKWQDHESRLHDQLNEKQEQVNILKSQLEDEKEDVEKLHSFSLDNVFSTIAGNKQEKLDERKKEVVTAKLKYQEGHHVLLELKSELQDYQTELTRLGDVDREYQNLLNRKEELIHDQASLWSQELFEITENEADFLGGVEEFQEAIEAGRIALQALNEAGASFDKAKGWSTFDLFGGGILTTAIKHNHLDTAKETVHTAEKRLRQFKDELLGIKNHLKVDLDMSKLLTFADYFFDGIIVNWMVHDKISNAANQIDETKHLVHHTIDQLHHEQKAMVENLNELSIQRIKVIEKA